MGDKSKRKGRPHYHARVHYGRKLQDAPLTVEDWAMVHGFWCAVVRPFLESVAERAYARQNDENAAPPT